MTQKNNQERFPVLFTLMGVCLTLLISGCGLAQPEASAPTPTETSLPTDVPSATPTDVPSATPTSEPTEIPSATSSPTPTETSTPTQTPTQTSTPTETPTATPSPTPTLALGECQANGCDVETTPELLNETSFNMLLAYQTPQRRYCADCPENPFYSSEELDQWVGADQETLNRLREVVLSQQSYVITPGLVYINYDEVHHAVVDLEATNLRIRNIVPPINTPEMREKIRITPSYCFGPDTLLAVTADYHGLNGSNKTDNGRDIFFHMGRAELFKMDDRFDMDVISDRELYQQTSMSWGGGPIFMWDGAYNYNPKNEWFEPETLEYYRTVKWAKMTVAISTDRKYLFLTISYGKTLEEHAENIISLGEQWGIEVDRAMRFDGSESAYMAFRFGDYMLPIINLEEPLIVNCLTAEAVRE